MEKEAHQIPAGSDYVSLISCLVREGEHMRHDVDAVLICWGRSLERVVPASDGSVD